MGTLLTEVATVYGDGLKDVDQVRRLRTRDGPQQKDRTLKERRLLIRRSAFAVTGICFESRMAPRCKNGIAPIKSGCGRRRAGYGLSVARLSGGKGVH